MGEEAKSIVILSMHQMKHKLLNRAHMLAKYLRKSGYTVTYVDRVATLNPLKLGRCRREKVDGIEVRSIYGLPYFRSRSRLAFRLNDWLIGRALHGLIDEQVLVVKTPHWARAVAQYANVFYDVSDDFGGFARRGRRLTLMDEYEAIIAGNAKAIIVSAESLLEKFERSKCHAVENGVDLDAFAQYPLHTRRDGPLTAGYIGGLFDWVDLELIEETAARNPNVRFLLVGPTNRPTEVKRLNQQHNLEYVGEVDRTEIGRFFSQLDIGLIPFVSEADYPRLRSVNSHKVYQYLYFGYPVVATAFPQVRKLAEYVHVAETRDQFMRSFSRALVEEGNREERRSLAKTCSWENRVRSIAQIIEGA